MDGRRAARIAGWTVAGALVVLALAATSFCVAFRAKRNANVVIVPDWTGVARDEATRRAAELGLVFEVAERRHDPGVAADRVLSQEPGPATKVRRGRTIRAVVSLGGETITVPEVTGQPSRQVEMEIRRLGLVPGWDARVHDAATDAGRVIAQSPSGGTLSVPGEPVHRLVSEGARPARFVMPDLRERTLREVQEWITLCGFRAGPVRRVRSDGRAAGTVVGQLPLPGHPIERRDAVELSVAE